MSTTKTSNKKPVKSPDKSPDKSKMSNKAPAKKPLTTAEKLKLLEGYEKYEDPLIWNTIPIGSHVRLLKKDGSFIRGGFVVKFYMADNRPYLLLENNKYNRSPPNYLMFKINLDEVKRIFVKPDMSIPTNSAPQQMQPIQSQRILPFEEPRNVQSEEIELLEKKIELLEKIISQKDSELNSLRKRVGALENTTSGIMKYLKQQSR